MAAPKSDRLPSLDLLRGLAAIAVMLSHYIMYSTSGASSTAEIAVSAAVEVFFVLSGFVLGPQILMCAQQRSWITLKNIPHPSLDAHNPIIHRSATCNIGNIWVDQNNGFPPLCLLCPKFVFATQRAGLLPDRVEPLGRRMVLCILSNFSSDRRQARKSRRYLVSIPSRRVTFHSHG